MDRVRQPGKALTVNDKVLTAVRFVSACSGRTLVGIASAL